MSNGKDKGLAQGIGRQMASGTLWMVATRWLIRLIGLFNTAIIARLLMPEDFGIVALAMIAVDFAITVTDGDVDMALVRSSDHCRGFSDTGWTLKVLSGFVTGGFLFAGAPAVSHYFGDSRLVEVIHIAALKPMLLGFENIGVIEFRRRLHFYGEFRYLVIQRLVSFVLCLVLVFTFRNYLALAWSCPASASVTVLVSYLVVPSRPTFSLSHWRELWVFSRWQMIFNSSRLVGERCDQFFIGLLSGFGNTGLYAVGFDLAMMPTREIMMPAGRALMPSYSKIADDPAAMKAAFAMVLGFAALIASSVGIGMTCVAEDAVLVILGEQWRAAVPFVRWLGIFGALEGVWLMLDPYLIATRHERTLALANLAFVVVMVPALALTTVRYGIWSVPICRVLVMAACLGFALMRLVAWRWISSRQLIEAIWRPMTAAAMMALVVLFVHQKTFSVPLLSLIHDIIIGSLTFVSCQFLFWFLAGRPVGVEQTLIHLATTRPPAPP